MRNAEYWKQRFKQLEQAQHRKGVNALAEIERQYRAAQKELDGQISHWYQRLANNNGISLAQARQYLKGSDLMEFQWDVQDYIKHGEDNALNQAWMKQLENASAKYHISKLEALKIQIQQSLEVMFAKQSNTMFEALFDIYRSGYYHTAFELQKGFNIGWDIARINQGQLEKILAKPWAVNGYNFSERIWNNKSKLISEVHSELTRNIMLGADPQKAIDSIAKKMNNSKSNTGRLVMTEEAYFSSLAQKECFHDLDVEQYEIVATLDSHTSDICRSLDRKIFPMKDFQAGVTAPPFHVNCRSTTAPYFDENFGDIGERSARGNDKKTYYVPSNMTYQEWEKAFVQSGGKEEFPSFQNNDRLKINNGASETVSTVEQIKQTMTEQVSALPDVQKQMLQQYTGFTAHRINTAIQKNHIIPKIQKEIDLLDTALKDGVMPEKVILHRDTVLSYLGLGLPDKPTEEELSKIVGRTITNPIFTSTSFENLGLPGRNAEMWILVPAGYRGCQYIKPVATEKYRYQEEVLFARGLKFRIIKVKMEDKKYVLIVEVLP